MELMTPQDIIQNTSIPCKDYHPSQKGSFFNTLPGPYGCPSSRQKMEKLAMYKPRSVYPEYVNMNGSGLHVCRSCGKKRPAVTFQLVISTVSFKGKDTVFDAITAQCLCKDCAGVV